MPRRAFLKACSAAAAAMAAAGRAAAAPGPARRRPNIVFILADDLGYSELG
ncbi:MAG TPA: twin-arginine translocation signal domain-containing protein, partial [Phycisphaerae bacterium]|nr:twin-arginine translocation signal domain-containing protein [Phycisphaerae bacterium]